MTPQCPKCIQSPLSRSKVVSSGHYYRKSDRQWIRKFRCKVCSKYFSRSTGHPCYRQNKRQINETLRRLFSSGVSQRRAAKLLRVSRTTVSRKLWFLGQQSEIELSRHNLAHQKAEIIEFDDLETFEHTKYKPLSVTLAVESGSRRILGFEVSQMPAKGLLAKRAVKKYGFRPDHRSTGRDRLFIKLRDLVLENAQFKSDQNPHYPLSLKKHFPKSFHHTFEGQRGSIVGQGELKKIRFDPLFSLNHTCAMLRANVNRLFRRTWCTTKKAERLRAHLAIYALYHNLMLI